MAWKKLGLIFDISEHKIPWLKSHAMLPTPLLMEEKIRVYYTGRDSKGQSRISFVDLDRDDPSQVLYVHDLPLLEVGKIGTFDDCGTVGTFVMETEGQIRLFYNGYNVRNTVPWSNSIGIAVSNDNGESFTRLYEGPIMDRSFLEPYFVITPFIQIFNNKWHMWYTSGTGWTLVNNKPEPLYVIKYASSDDGLSWIRDNITCIKPTSPEEANARSTVIKQDNLLRMWFCFRGSRDFRDGVDSYKIGYAEASTNEPTLWERDDSTAGINCGPEPYDDKMQAYPAVIDLDEKKYLFYNGNGFGIAGFCCAIWAS